MRTRTEVVSRFIVLGGTMTLVWWLVAAVLPVGPSYTLTALTERLELEVPESPSPVVWGGLEARQIDGGPADCPLKALPIGTEPVKIVITGISKRATKGTGAPWTVEVYPRGPGAPLSLACANGRTREVHSVLLLEAARAAPPLTLTFSGTVTAGAAPDIQGGESRILLAGTLRGTERLKGSAQPGASGQYDLLTGDRIVIDAVQPGRVPVTGMIWRDEDGLKLVAHATQARITIDRPGVGRLEQLSLRPGLIAVLLANPTLLLVCTLLATALTYFPTVEGYFKRVRAALLLPRTRAPKEDRQ